MGGEVAGWRFIPRTDCASRAGTLTVQALEAQPCVRESKRSPAKQFTSQHPFAISRAALLRPSAGGGSTCASAASPETSPCCQPETSPWKRGPARPPPSPATGPRRWPWRRPRSGGWSASRTGRCRARRPTTPRSCPWPPGGQRQTTGQAEEKPSRRCLQQQQHAGRCGGGREPSGHGQLPLVARLQPPPPTCQLL